MQTTTAATATTKKFKGGIKLVSNVIELKKDKEYIFVFDASKIHPDTIQDIADEVGNQKIKGIFIAIEDASGLQIIEKSRKHGKD